MNYADHPIRKVDRVLKKLNKALDRAIAAKTPTDTDPWCLKWSQAYRREVYRLSKR
jgi:DNA topoisomerase VI subunit A